MRLICRGHSKYGNRFFFSTELVLQETARLVDHAVDTLPLRCKKIIKLSLLGYKNGEIANELEITLNTVKAQKK